MKLAPIGKYASIIYRMNQQFYDKRLAKHRIGSGQQFFLMEIDAHPGISVLELARQGHFDNGSATRAAQKLESEGYIRIEPDSRDRRIRRMYPTDRAPELIADTVASKREWFDVLVDGLSEEDVKNAERLFLHMSENAVAFMKKENEKKKEQDL